MKKLLEFLIQNILGEADFETEESEIDNQVNLTIKCDPKYIGFIIGKRGATIKSLRNLLRVRAALEKKQINISIAENIAN